MTHMRLFALTLLIASPTMRAGTPVAVWLTTGDRRALLSRQDSIAVIYNATLSAGQPTIEVDESKSYQQMIGFGAAMTDASAYLIQNKLSAADREALLQDLFGRCNAQLGARGSAMESRA